jgi:rubrerythrin
MYIVISYECEQCKFSFKVEDNDQPKTCPHCNKTHDSYTRELLIVINHLTKTNI